MCEKFDDIMNKAKISQLISKNKAEEEKKSCILWVLAIIGAVASVAAIAYAVYRHMTPRYLDDFDGDFENIGMAVGDWKDNKKNYERIMGILVDTRFLMTHYTGSPESHIAALAQSIEKAFSENDGLLPKNALSD